MQRPFGEISPADGLTAQDMKEAGLSLPLLVGGAALSRKFTDSKIAGAYDGLVLYAKDAMTGLSLANQLQFPEEVEKLLQVKNDRLLATEISGQSLGSSAVSVAVKPKRSVATDVPVFIPEDTKRHILRSYSLSHIEPYINMQMLMGHHQR